MSNEEAQTNAAGGQSVLTDGLGLRRTVRAAMWLALNGAFAALLWFGFVEGVEGARNLSLFLVWANFIVSFGMLVPDIQKELAKKGRSVPKPANALYDLGVTFFLAWFGAWVSAVAYAVHIVLQEAGWDAALKSRPNA